MKIFGALFSADSPDQQFGRIVADFTLLEALIQENAFDQYHLFFQNQTEITSFQSKFPSRNIYCFLLDDIPDKIRTTPYFVFHAFSPFLTKLIYLRDQFAPNPFPITGFTHSLAHQPLMSGYLYSLLAQPQPYDGIICSCESAKTTFSSLMTYLSESYNPLFKQALAFPGELEIIPIGITPPTASPVSKQILRNLLGLPEDAVIFFSLSRFSPVTKMDLFSVLTMILNIKEENLCFVFAGATNGEQGYIQSIQQWITGHHMENRIKLFPDITDKDSFYKAADVYFAPADNFQETYGITLIEAMKYGLPILAYDWDGYRNTVEEGQNGFLISTYYLKGLPDFSRIAPIIGDKYALLYAQSMFVDQHQLLEKIQLLFSSENLRIQFGQNSSTRSQKYYWPTVVTQYMRFWTHLNEKAQIKNTGFKLPSLDFEHVFRHYPTTWLKDPHQIRLCSTQLSQKVDSQLDVYEELKPYLHLETIQGILAFFESPKLLAELLRFLPVMMKEKAPEVVMFQVSWLLKQNFLEIKFK